MRWLIGSGLVVVAIAACGDDDASPGGSLSETSPDGGTTSSGGPTNPGTTADGGKLPTDPGSITPPTPTCTPPATASDVSKPTVTLGAPGGPPCTEAGLQTALDQGGIITFQCGGTAAAPTVITLTSERTVDKDTVIDGGGTVTLSGNKVTRILHIGHGNFEAMGPKIVVQKLNFVDGHTTDVAATRKTDKGGAAIYRLGATLTVIDSKFLNNVGPTDGQDVAGGAIYSVGGGDTTIVGSTFSGNTCSNGGAVGNLGIANLSITNSSFMDNAATGKNANPGNGGNGGAVTIDGPASTGKCPGAVGPFTPKTVSICGSLFQHNSGGVKALGGALFRTVDTVCVPKNTAPVTIDRTTFEANESDSAGAVYLHQADVTLTNSTFSNNTSRAGAAGAIWLEGSDGADATLNLTNVTVTNNTAKEALGGGFFIGAHIGGGEFLHVTVAQNSVTTDSGNPYAVFGAGLVGDVSKVKLTNSVFANNHKPAPVSGDSANCQSTFIDGGGNIEFTPDHPDPKRCAAGSALTDPALTALADNEGPTKTMSRAAAAKTVSANCTTADQRGKPRTAPCAAGAYEPQ